MYVYTQHICVTESLYCITVIVSLKQKTKMIDLLCQIETKRKPMIAPKQFIKQKEGAELGTTLPGPWPAMARVLWPIAGSTHCLLLCLHLSCRETKRALW